MIDKIPPELYVLSPDKRKCYGVVRMITEESKDIRFNSCSELSFKVDEKTIDPYTGETVYNSVYDYLEKDILLYHCDDTEYFSFPNRTLRTDYGIKSSTNFPLNEGRAVTTNATVTYDNQKISGDSGVLTGFKLQPETDLRHISIVGGYNWWNLSSIDDFGFIRNPQNWDRYFEVACDTFVPIDIYDVIAVKTKNDINQTGSDIRYNRYTILFYDGADANHCLGWLFINSGFSSDGMSPPAQTQKTKANPVYRFSINSLTGDEDLYFLDSSMTLKEFKKRIKENGYIRVEAKDCYADSSASISTKKQYSSYKYIDNGKTWIGWTFPYDGWCVIYSGVRYCSQIDNDKIDGVYGLPLRWFVIKDISEDYDGFKRTKTITAVSYEYTISYKSISLSEDTLPLYIPDKILDTVNGDNWVIDKAKGSNTVIKSRQYMAKGLLNQVLEVLPDWSIGHISSELMTKYRKINDVDNANIYSFLMEDIQKLYQCYFIFDSDNKTISAYTQNDIINNSTPNVILNWDNALQFLNRTNKDINISTALRIHTSDDTYGLGLVIPTGNNIYYNFQDILNQLDYVADDSDDDPLQRNKIVEDGVIRNRTLREAAVALMRFYYYPKSSRSDSMIVLLSSFIGDTIKENTYIRKEITISTLYDYRNIARKFIQYNLERIKSEASINEYISNYKSVLNKIEVLAEQEGILKYYKEETIRFPDKLQEYYDFNSGGSYLHRLEFVNLSLYQELYNSSVDYHKALAQYEAINNDYKVYYDILKAVSARANLNYSKQLKLTNLVKKRKEQGLPDHVDEDGNYIYLSILTPKEIMALQPYIREGDWTNDNSIFSEDYDVNDVMNTLIETYNQAKNDMDSFISKYQYDFETKTTNISRINEMQINFNNIKVGQTLYINTEKYDYVVPVLLEMHLNYFDDEDYNMKFTTDYRRKPWQYRFADLYSTISQTSVTNSTFIFDEE